MELTPFRGHLILTEKGVLTEADALSRLLEPERIDHDALTVEPARRP